MFEIYKKAEMEFYERIFNAAPFKMIYGENFDYISLKYFAKQMSLGIIKGILRPNFDEILRDACLREIGKTCAEMFLKYSDIDTDTDVDTFIKKIEIAFQGHRTFERRGTIIYEAIQCNGECWCPIVSNIGLGQDCSIWCNCSTNARHTLFATILSKPVQVELLDSVLYTGSDTCRWMIHI